MDATRVLKKCAICGKEEYYIEIYSNFCRGMNDLDLKPNGAMASCYDYIQECPSCHYCNYNISKLVGNRYSGDDRVELWKKDMNDIISNSKYNDDIKKSLIMAKQYKNVGEDINQYKMVIQAAWAANGDLAKELKLKAMNIYFNSILENRRIEFMQLADIARQVEEFDVAKELNELSKLLINENDKNSDFIKKVIDFEKNLIYNKDIASHNLSEIE